MIRPMQKEDIPTLIDMGREFHAESPIYNIYTFEEQKLYELGLHILNDINSICLVYDKDGIQGMMAGCIYEQYFSYDTTAAELFLFANKDKRGALIGKRLVTAFELWASSMNAMEVCVGVSAGINPDRIVGFYEKMGYGNTSKQLRKVM